MYNNTKMGQYTQNIFIKQGQTVEKHRYRYKEREREREREGDGETERKGTKHAAYFLTNLYYCSLVRYGNAASYGQTYGLTDKQPDGRTNVVVPRTAALFNNRQVERNIFSISGF